MISNTSFANTSLKLNNASWNDKTEGQHVPVFYIVLLMTLVIAGGTGNIIVMSSVTRKRHRTPVHMPVVNLAVVDAIVCVVQIPLTILNILAGLTENGFCALTGILGNFLFNYSFQIQCLILYSHVRIVTAPLHFKAQAVTYKRFGLCSTLCLVTGAFLAIFPPIKYGYMRHLPAVGYCFFGYDWTSVIRVVLTFTYSCQFIVIVFLCCFFYIRLIRYVKKHSARRDLANQRHVVLFRIMARKLIVWAACYTLLITTRYADRTLDWHGNIYRASYFLVWINSVLNPVIQIFSKSTRRMYIFRFLGRVSPDVSGVNVISVNPK